MPSGVMPRNEQILAPALSSDAMVLAGGAIISRSTCTAQRPIARVPTSDAVDQIKNAGGLRHKEFDFDNATVFDAGEVQAP